MKRNILLAATIFIVITIMIFLVPRMITANKPNTVPAQGAPAKEDTGTREEDELFKLASKYEQSGDLLNLRDTYQKIMEKFPGSYNIQKAHEGLENANMRILFSSIPTPDSISYEIQKGDTLAKIAKKFSTTQELILKTNNLRDPKVVPLGRKLKIHNESFSIIVDKSQNILTLKSADKIVKTYRVSTGINNCTPVGTFKVINKIVDPPWYTAGTVFKPDDPKNILGSRWLGLSAQGYGIHGTTQPQSIGKQVTSGCVRMKNSDVEELYSVVPEGTEVVIVD